MTDSTQDLMYKWHRVSLLSIVYFFLTRGLRIIKELAINAAPLLAGLYLAVNDKVFWLTIATIGFFVFTILDIVALYFSYRYRVEDDQIIVRQGIFKKEILNLKYGRVQNINNAVPWYFKPFDLVRCTLDSAGSAAKEASIPGISKARSDAIANIIHSFQQKHIPDTEINSDAKEKFHDDTYTLKLTNWQVSKFGFTNSMIFVFAGVLFPLVEKITESTGIDLTDKFSEIARALPFQETVSFIFLVFLSILVIGFLLLSITALGAFVRFYNFELYDEGKKLKRIAGLLERQTIFINKSKVQGITIKQNVFARLLGMASIYFQQTQSDGKKGGKKQAFIIPWSKPTEWQQQLSMIYPDLVDIPLNFTSIERQYFHKVTLYGCLLPISFIALPLSMYNSSSFLLLYLLSIPILSIAYLRYRRYGYCILENYLIIRNGIIGTNYHILHRYKAQHLSQSTSPSQRRLNMGSLSVQMAYSDIKLPYIKQTDLRQIINQTIYLAESTQKSWM